MIFNPLRGVLQHTPHVIFSHLRFHQWPSWSVSIMPVNGTSRAVFKSSNLQEIVPLSIGLCFVKRDPHLKASLTRAPLHFASFPGLLFSLHDWTGGARFFGETSSWRRRGGVLKDHVAARERGVPPPFPASFAWRRRTAYSPNTRGGREGGAVSQGEGPLR